MSVKHGIVTQESDDAVPDPGELLASEIGSDKDFAARALQREIWASLEKKERHENTSVRRANLMHEGFHAGYEAAADDYVNGLATTDVFEGLREDREISDFYAIGFELGYTRKLAEIALN
jgi:hypothetical protein